MDFVLLASVILLFIGAKPFLKKYNEDYISRDQTQCINGFFVLIVFMRHFQFYIEYGQFDMIYGSFSDWLRQMLVVPFLFYSGYGIMLSLTKKGNSYVNSIMTKRFPKVLLHFAIAVGLFLITDICLGVQYPINTILLSFIGWESIGNSNWYIFDTLILYIITFVSFKMFRVKRWAGLLAMFVLTGIFIWHLMSMKDPWWFNTCIMFPLGMAYTLVKEKVDSFFRRFPVIYYAALVLSAAFLAFISTRKMTLLKYELYAVSIMAFILLLTMKLKIGNPVLRFLGKHIFEIYILQRLPMLILKDTGLNSYVFFGICLAVTIVLAIGFGFLMRLLDNLIDGKYRKKNKPEEIIAG